MVCGSISGGRTALPPLPLSTDTGEAGRLENVGRDDIGTALHQSLLRCSCKKKSVNHSGTIFSMLSSLAPWSLSSSPN